MRNIHPPQLRQPLRAADGFPARLVQRMVVEYCRVNGTRRKVKTLRIAVTATFVSLLISYPISYFLSRLKGTQKTFFVLLLFLPFWTSYVIRTFVWLPILGRYGAINQVLQWLGVVQSPVEWFLYNDGAVFVGLIYVYVLFMTLPIYQSLDKIDPDLIEAAVELGARPIHVFWRIILPLSRPGVIAGCIIVFLLAMSAYVTPQLLGGTRGIMYANIIANNFLSDNNWAMGATLSVTLIGIVIALLLSTSRWIGIREIFSGGRF